MNKKHKNTLNYRQAKLVMPNTHRRRDETVLSRRCRRCVHEFATTCSSRRLPTVSIDNLETGQTDSIAV